MKTLINGRLILPDSEGNYKIYTDKILNFNEKIISFDQDLDSNEIIDAKNSFVAPGFINIHIHGCAGFDTMDSTPEALKKICEFLPTTGVTSFLPTTMTMPIEKIYCALENIRHNLKSYGAKILGVNLEGPFISKKFCGAQSSENILSADFKLIENFSDIIKIITIAPEKVSTKFINQCLNEGIIISIGHSAADYETALLAIKHGATHITHLFNAQTGFHHREPGIVGAALDTDVMIELIADNIHVHPIAQRIVKKLKNVCNIILITDSMRACGISDSISELGGQKVFING